MRNRKTVADVMTAEVVAVPPVMRFKRLAELLAERHVSAVPVVGEAGQVLGVVSESDLIRKEESQRRSPIRTGLSAIRAKAQAVTAAGLMTSPAITVRSEASLPEAAGLMAEHGVTRLIVTADGRPDGALVGVVTRSDLLSVFCQSDHEVHAAVQRSLVDNALWDDPFVVHVKVRDGMVTLTGELERRGLTRYAVQVAPAVDGVVGVVDRLKYLIDDSTMPASPDPDRLG